MIVLFKVTFWKKNALLDNYRLSKSKYFDGIVPSILDYMNHDYISAHEDIRDYDYKYKGLSFDILV